MINVNFYLKDKKATESLIYIYLTFEGQRLKFSTKTKIPSSAWKEGKQIVKSNHTGSGSINKKLKKFEARAKDAYHDGPGSLDWSTHFRERIFAPDNKEEKPKLKPKATVPFFQAYEEFLEISKHQKTDGVIRHYRSTKYRLEKFETDMQYTIDFNSINSTFFEKFTNYLYDEHSLTNNTVGSYIKRIKTFMNYTLEKGLHKNYEFQKLKVYKEEADVVYLTQNEINRIVNLELTKGERLDNVRTLFLIGCFTGLRYSDFSTITKENIKDGYLSLQTRKTKHNLIIPLNSTSEKLVNQIVNKEVNQISNVKMNLYLKELCELAEINEELEIIRHKGTVRIRLTKPKFEVVGTHTGRRTFITLSLEKGMRPEVVMEISGHQDYRTFKKYIRLTDKVKKNEFARAWGE